MSAPVRPAIGILAPFTHATYGAWSQSSVVLPEDYVRAVNRAGGLALVLAPDPAVTAEPDELLDRLDGLLLSGGSDLDPSLYDQEPHPETQAMGRERDEWEIALAARAIRRDLPVLGICRGMQVMNVAAGGTLHQHLPDSLGHGEHRRVLGSFDGAEHDVRIVEGSLAARAAGEVVHVTKSHHHQGVDRVGAGFACSAISTLDDLVEAIELPERRFVLGVQWHPEVDDQSTVIAAFVQAAREARDGRAAAALR